MRHRKHRFGFGLTKEHREALMGNLACALIRHGQIQTTLAKAKALRPFVEKIITYAKKAQGASAEVALHYRRRAMARLRNEEVVKILFNERVGEFLERSGGYTRIYKIGQRTSDAAEMALICFIEASDEGYTKRRKSNKAKAAIPAGAAAEEAAPVEEGEVATEVAEEPVATEAPAEEAVEEPSEETKPQ